MPDLPGRFMNPDILDYEPEHDEPYVPVTCLSCREVIDEVDLWMHYAEEHALVDLRVEDV